MPPARNLSGPERLAVQQDNTLGQSIVGRLSVCLPQFLINDVPHLLDDGVGAEHGDVVWYILADLAEHLCNPCTLLRVNEGVADQC